jgi:hypothetical protein
VKGNEGKARSSPRSTSDARRILFVWELREKENGRLAGSGPPVEDVTVADSRGFP